MHPGEYCRPERRFRCSLPIGRPVTVGDEGGVFCRGGRSVRGRWRARSGVPARTRRNAGSQSAPKVGQGGPEPGRRWVLVQCAALQLWQDRRAVGEAVAVQERAQPGRQVRERAESCLGEQARRGEGHEGLRRRGEVGQRAGGLGGVPVDERDRYPVPVDGVPRAEVAVGDDLPGSWRPRAGTVAGDAWLEAGGRRVQFADQPSCSAQGQIGSGIGGSRCPCPGCQPGSLATSPSMKVRTSRSPSIPSSRGAPPKPAASRCRRYSCTGGRPWSHRPQQPVTAPRHPAGHPPAGDRHLARPRLLVAGHQTSIATAGACQPALPEGLAGHRPGCPRPRRRVPAARARARTGRHTPISWFCSRPAMQHLQPAGHAGRRLSDTDAR